MKTIEIPNFKNKLKKTKSQKIHISFEILGTGFCCKESAGCSECADRGLRRRGSAPGPRVPGARPPPPSSPRTPGPRGPGAPHSHFYRVGRRVARFSILTFIVLVAEWPDPAFSLLSCWSRSGGRGVTRPNNPQKPWKDGFR